MLWYVRDKNKVIGPFPTGQIQQGILLGRISISAEVSKDKEEWEPLRQRPQLIPDVLKSDVNDEHARERLAAARRWADERRRERRSGEVDTSRQGRGRRNQESYETLEYRDHREAIVKTLQPSQERVVVGVIAILLVLAAGVYAGFKWIPQLPAGPQCDAVASRGVDWHQCNKVGVQILNADLSAAKMNSIKLSGANLFGSKLSMADLSYADLSHANLSFTDFQQAQLKGANLRAADLSKANFTNADLSYANLENAKLSDTSYTNANFSNAIWINGSKCLTGSIGECRVAK
jgi:hypothetical protein